jgi:hypothetical protein
MGLTGGTPRRPRARARRPCRPLLLADRQTSPNANGIFPGPTLPRNPHITHTTHKLQRESERQHGSAARPGGAPSIDRARGRTPRPYLRRRRSRSLRPRRRRRLRVWGAPPADDTRGEKRGDVCAEQLSSCFAITPKLAASLFATMRLLELVWWTAPALPTGANRFHRSRGVHRAS